MSGRKLDDATAPQRTDGTPKRERERVVVKEN